MIPWTPLIFSKKWFFRFFNTIAVIINENYTLMAALKTYMLDEKIDACCYANKIKNTKNRGKKTPMMILNSRNSCLRKTYFPLKSLYCLVMYLVGFCFFFKFFPWLRFFPLKSLQNWRNISQKKSYLSLVCLIYFEYLKVYEK